MLLGQQYPFQHCSVKKYSMANKYIKTGKESEPHHIFPIRSDRNKLFELTNGITLCRPCHQKTIWKESSYIERFSQLVVAH